MSSFNDRVLAQDELRALSVRSNWPGAIRLAVHVTLLGLAGWWVAVAEGWVVWPAMLVLGLVQVALFAPSHETMHQTVFTSSRANAIVGWLTFLPGLQSSHFYAAFHYIHHRHTNVPGEDPELMLPEPKTLAEYVARILGAGYFRARFIMIRDAWRNEMKGPRYFFINDRQRPAVVASVRAMSLTVAALALGSAAIWGWKTPFMFWLIPQLIGQPFLRGYLLAEHTGCTLDRNGLTNTRTTLTNRAVRLLMWDMPFHAEHHLYPSIPFHRLKDAHALLREKLRFVQPGYARFNASFVRSLRDG
jgi:fatty acid desaturase